MEPLKQNYALDVQILGMKIRIKDRVSVYVVCATILCCALIAARVYYMYDGRVS